MLSVSVYDLTTVIQDGEIPIQETQHFTENRNVSGTEENLETYIFVNETTPTGYKNYRIISDEVLDYSARVHGQHFDQLVRQGMYQVYYHPTHKRLVALCKKDEAKKVATIFERNFQLNFEKHCFNILSIITEATDVRGAKFDVQIETVRGVTIRGTNVNNTEYYAGMMNSGDMTAVTATYDAGDRNVTFRISVDGTLLFYTALSDYEYLEFIDMLYNL